MQRGATAAPVGFVCRFYLIIENRGRQRARKATAAGPSVRLARARGRSAKAVRARARDVSAV